MDRGYASPVATLYRCPMPTERLCACGRVARELRRQGVEFEEVRVSWLRRGRGEVQELSGQRVVPLLVTDEATICDSRRIVEHLRRRAPAEEPAVEQLEELVDSEPVTAESPLVELVLEEYVPQASSAEETEAEPEPVGPEPVAAGQLIIEFFGPVEDPEPYPPVTLTVLHYGGQDPSPLPPVKPPEPTAASPASRPESEQEEGEDAGRGTEDPGRPAPS